MMKKIIGFFSVFTFACFSTTFTTVVSAADRCSPEMLEKLPPNKREAIEKNCAKRAEKSAYKISNEGKIDTQKRPKDKYKGDDAAELTAMIKASWSQKYPKDKIMGIHLSAADWKRTQNKRWNEAINAWQFTDVSVLPAKVVVKTSDKIATIFPAYINKDNTDNTLNTGVATKTSEYVINQMLVENY
jgi:hypothetical protein